MATRNVRIVMNGVTGRMGYRQHLLRSVLAIRDDGGITLPDGGRLQVEPVLVGRNHAKLAGIARAHDVADFTTDLDAALADESATVYFDAPATGGRRKTILTAIAAGKHVSATGSFPATCSRRSARAGTAAPRRAAASSWTCSRTGATSWRTCSAGCAR